MKKMLSLLMAATMVMALLTGCGGGNGSNAGSAGSEDEVYTLKLAHQASETNPWQWTSLKFEELVEERSGDKVQVDVYFGGTLGFDRDLIEGMQAGTVDLALVTTAPLVNFVPDVGALDLPYVFKNWDDLMAFMDSDAAAILKEEIAAQGLDNICFYPQGFRHATNNVRPITGLEDLKGLKMRVMQSDVFIDTFNAMGASAVPMGWSEVPTSLQQGTIDGQENGTITNYSNNIWEYQKYMSLTGHCAYMTTLLGSSKLLSKLPAEYYDIVVQAGIEAVEYGVQRIQEEEVSILEEIKNEKGMPVNELDEAALAEMAAVTEPVRAAFAEEYGGEILDSIKEITG